MAPLYWQGTLEAAEVGRSRGRKGQKGAKRVEMAERRGGWVGGWVGVYSMLGVKIGSGDWDI